MSWQMARSGRGDQMIGHQTILRCQENFCSRNRRKSAHKFRKVQRIWAPCYFVPLEVGVLLCCLENLHIMAPHPTAHLSSLHNQEDLSDEQVAALLKEAEDRLRLRTGDTGGPQSSALRKP
jgi:hypothetical protein